MSLFYLFRNVEQPLIPCCSWFLCPHNKSGHAKLTSVKYHLNFSIMAITMGSVFLFTIPQEVAMTFLSAGRLTLTIFALSFCLTINGQSEEPKKDEEPRFSLAVRVFNDDSEWTESYGNRIETFLWKKIDRNEIERVGSTEEAKELAARYIAENVVGPTSFDDCLHIALATLTHADVLEFQAHRQRDSNQGLQ